jgi:hypothetical protein
VNEREWLECGHPHLMIGHLRADVSIWKFLFDNWYTKLFTRRKMHLFACACVRQMWDALPNQQARSAVECAERYADGHATERELDRANSWISKLCILREPRAAAAYRAGLIVTGKNICGGLDKLLFQCAFAIAYSASADTESLAYKAALANSFRQQAGLLRDIVGTPFHLNSVAPFGVFRQDATVSNLAQAVYQARSSPAGFFDPARLLALADALDQAGCVEPFVSHLRQPTEHVRGCWVIDHILDLSSSEMK